MPPEGSLGDRAARRQQRWWRNMRCMARPERSAAACTQAACASSLLCPATPRCPAPALETMTVRPLRLMVRQNSGLEVTSRHLRRTMAARHRSSKHRCEKTRFSRCSLVNASSRAASPSSTPALASASSSAAAWQRANATLRIGGERNTTAARCRRRHQFWACPQLGDRVICSQIMFQGWPGLQVEPQAHETERAGAGSPRGGLPQSLNFPSCAQMVQPRKLTLYQHGRV